MKQRATPGSLLALAICVAATLAAPAHAERMTRQRIASMDEQPRAGSHHQTSPWTGGASSLPYNIEGLTEQQIRDHALGMAGVVEAMNSFQARGYIRRADLDTFYVGVGFSGLVLGYEKPGVPVMEKQPVIVVQSQAIPFQNEGWFPATTIGGFVARDSMINDSVRVPVVDRDPADAPMLVYQQPISSEGSAQTPGMSPDSEALYCWYAYSMKEGYDVALSLRRYLPTVSPEAAQWWYGLSDAMAAGATSGLISGGVLASTLGLGAIPPGMALGLLQGTVSSITNYAFTHPFPVSNPGP